MRITCPECHSGYEVNLPNLDEKGVTVECAKCHNNFLVKKEVVETVATDRETEKGSNSLTQETTAQAQENPPTEPEIPLMDDVEIDEEKMLAALLNENKSPDTSPEPASNEETPDENVVEAVDAAEQPDENLDNLLDNLINEEIAEEDDQPAKQAEGTDADSIEINEEDDFEKLLDENPQDEAPESAEDVKEETETPLPQENETTDDLIEQMLQEHAELDEDDELAAEESLIDELTAMDDKNPAETEPDEEETPVESAIGMEEVDIETDTDEATADDPETAADEEKAGEEKTEEDLLAKAFADQEKTEAEAAEEEKNEENLFEETLDDQEKTEEDLLAEAFADQEKTEAEAAEPEAVETAAETETVEEATATETVEEEAEKEEETEDEEDNDEEETEEEEDDDATEEEYEEEEEEAPAKKLFGFIPLPSAKTGKFFIGGAVLAILLTAGGVYFGFNTFLPSKQNQATKPQDEVAVEQAKLSPAETTAAEKPVETATSAENAAPSAPTDTTENVQTAETVEPDKTTGTAGEPPASGQPAEGKAITPPVQAVPGDKAVKGEQPQEKGVLAAVAPTETTITLSAIMPVAFNVNDIRVLSFNLELEMDNNESAKVVREALPIYEKIMIQTVEKFFRNKFFNDILYVREKLQKRLQTTFNKSLRGGRVKKAQLKDFETS